MGYWRFEIATQWHAWPGYSTLKAELAEAKGVKHVDSYPSGPNAKKI